MPTNDQIARLYGTREVMEAVLDYVHGDVLDFGAGKGKQKPLLGTRAKTYTAIDIAPHPNVDIVGDILDPPIADSSYDTIVSNQVIEHVREPWTMMRQVARILRPNGMCIITAPFLVPYHAHPHDFFRFTEEGLKSLCESNGLKIILCTKYGGWWASAGETLRHRYFSPYKKRQNRILRFIGLYTERFFRLINTWCPPGIAYANVLCIAQKP